MGGAQTKQLGGFRICNYGENSLGKILELEISFDYIVGIDGVPLTQVSDASHDFFLKRLKGIGKHQVKINVYNSLSTRIRTIILNPNKQNEKTETVTTSRRYSAESEKDGQVKNAFVDGIECNIVEFDAPLNSLRVYQFLSYDERITGLGVGVHWEEISTKGIKVVNVQESSPAQTSGLISNEDYIVASSTLMRPFYSTDDFLAFVKKSDQVCLSFFVYNIETETTREIFITPNSSWGGKGLLGCDIAAGPLYDIPLREKEVSFSMPRHGNITYIEITSNNFDGKNIIQYNLKEENEVISKDILKEEFDIYENKEKVEDTIKDNDNTQNIQEIQLNEIPRENFLVKDYSFDLYRIKQSNESQFDEKQDIIEQALINSGPQNISEFSENLTRDSMQVPILENHPEITESSIDTGANNTSESFLMIPNPNVKMNTKTNFKSSSSSSDEDQSDEIASSLSINTAHLQINTEAPSSMEPILNENCCPIPIQPTSTSSVEPSLETIPHNQSHIIFPNTPNETNSIQSDSLLPQPQKTPTEKTPQEKPTDSNCTPDPSLDHFRPSSPKVDCSGMQMHGQLHVMAGNPHIISIETSQVKTDCEKIKDDSFVSNDRLLCNQVINNLETNIEQISEVNTDQKDFSSSLQVDKEIQSINEKNPSEGHKQNPNGQIEEFGSNLNQNPPQETPTEKHSLHKNSQEQNPRQEIKSMSPEDERACEILKSLIEIHPKLEYDPPGTIEYIDKGEI